MERSFLGTQIFSLSFIFLSVCRIKYQDYINMNDTDYDKRSALHLAACEGYVDAVKYLLNNNDVYHKGRDRCSIFFMYFLFIFAQLFFEITIFEMLTFL